MLQWAAREFLPTRSFVSGMSGSEQQRTSYSMKRFDPEIADQQQAKSRAGGCRISSWCDTRLYNSFVPYLGHDIITDTGRDYLFRRRTAVCWDLVEQQQL
jgi:hypothetical protein